ncbi:phosphonate metabolism protein/1,5-bisphosphokinase (PRPP-forming) PhnN [Methylobacterium sp. ID0610]|uniref:phosphonate metabolism protein/1,5-bisphosphokinase (PRPP-forming) PhnN n=1 Tax=Methylobacterium carpenticola TaxID=3344827 RepID=UPI0036976542
MPEGILFLVVGPSGAGKDTLIEGARAALGAGRRYVFARRVITRPPGSAGEDHEAMSEDAFAACAAAGGFLAAWSAHGLHYGLPRGLREDLAAGRHVVANGSRNAVAALADRVPRLVVVEVTAPPEVLAARIAGRARESGAALRARLARKAAALPDHLEVIRVANDAEPEIGIERFVAALEGAAARLRLRATAIDTGGRHLAFLPRDSIAVPAADYAGCRIEIEAGAARLCADVALAESGAWLRPDEIGLSTEAFRALGRPEATCVAIRRSPAPCSRDVLRRKIRGAELSEDEYETVLRDMVAGRYAEGEIAGFLVAANRFLSDDEVMALARVRARHAAAMRWDAPIVVDKHSMGGIPGSRITMIVVPIVAAHGLLIPKSSSRAITSAAGTADAMETLARVDLGPDEVHAAVARARGCVVWNGRLNHSPLDDVMNGITRPLGLASARWSVASILSKKLTAGATHVAMDLPWGPGARLADAGEAAELGVLLERIGARLGLTVEAVPTDGRAPIGRGIGPALEVRDVLRVLDGHPEAPADLREKALGFAARIIAWDPAVADCGRARQRAEALLASGAARAALEAIVEAQGRQPVPQEPGRLTHTVRAAHSGIVTGIDGIAISGLARTAGAPADKGAGVYLLARIGEPVRAGDPLLVLHANAPADLAAAAARAAAATGYRLDGAASGGLQ